MKKKELTPFFSPKAYVLLKVSEHFPLPLTLRLFFLLRKGVIICLHCSTPDVQTYMFASPTVFMKSVAYSVCSLTIESRKKQGSH